MMARSDAPAIAAEVANPERTLWPAKPRLLLFQVRLEELFSVLFQAPKWVCKPNKVSSSFLTSKISSTSSEKRVCLAR